MTNPEKKIIAAFVLTTMLTFVGGFCYAPAASAKVAEKVAVQSDMPGMQNCSQSVEIKPGPNQFQKGSPFGNSVMPCCVNRHDNTSTIVPNVLSGNVVFSGIADIAPSGHSTSLVKETAYISSSGPPPGPDILSSVLKKE